MVFHLASDIPYQVYHFPLTDRSTTPLSILYINLFDYTVLCASLHLQALHILCQCNLYSAVPSCLLFHSLPIITDLDFFLESLDSSLFPGIGSTIKVHSGFKESQAEYVWQFGRFRSLMNQNCLAWLQQSFRR